MYCSGDFCSKIEHFSNGNVRKTGIGTGQNRVGPGCPCQKLGQRLSGGEIRAVVKTALRRFSSTPPRWLAVNKIINRLPSCPPLHLTAAMFTAIHHRGHNIISDATRLFAGELFANANNSISLIIPAAGEIAEEMSAPGIKSRTRLGEYFIVDRQVPADWLRFGDYAIRPALHEYD